MRDRARGPPSVLRLEDMKNTRICVVIGDKTEHRPLEPIGTTIHFIPHERWLQQVNKTEASR